MLAWAVEATGCSGLEADSAHRVAGLLHAGLSFRRRREKVDSERPHEASWPGPDNDHLTGLSDNAQYSAIARTVTNAIASKKNADLSCRDVRLGECVGFEPAKAASVDEDFGADASATERVFPTDIKAHCARFALKAL